MALLLCNDWVFMLTHAKESFMLYCKKQTSIFLCCITREATTIIFLMLQEAVVLQACKDNKSTLERHEDATIKFLYAVNHKDDDNDCIFLSLACQRSQQQTACQGWQLDKVQQ
jgi:hypothetical protein